MVSYDKAINIRIYTLFINVIRHAICVHSLKQYFVYVMKRRKLLLVYTRWLVKVTLFGLTLPLRLQITSQLQQAERKHPSLSSATAIPAISLCSTARKMSKYWVFSGPYLAPIRENTHQKKLHMLTFFTQCKPPWFISEIICEPRILSRKHPPMSQPIFSVSQ